MKIQIVGAGGSRSRALARAAEKAAQSLGLEYELEKVTDLEHMVGLGVMATPALAVRGVVKVEGRVPGFEELRQILESERERACEMRSVREIAKEVLGRGAERYSGIADPVA